jgi:lysozyme family protein
MSYTWDAVFGIVLPIEGKLSLDPKDQGNYTPAGVLKGTKYGISAHAFPDEDIANLTLDRAKALAKLRYWDVIRGDELHPWLALLLFDSSYNEGDAAAVKHLQRALGIAPDGVFGGQTLLACEMAIHRSNLLWLMAEYTTQRNLSYTRDAGFAEYGHSWFARTALVLAQATQVHS